MRCRWVGAAGRIAYLIRHLECFRFPRQGGLLTVGDSITVGTGSPRFGFLTDDSWVAYVASMRSIPYGYNAAVPGQSTDELASRFSALLGRRSPDVVTIATGTNDVSATKAIDLIDSLITQAVQVGAVPVLATIPPLPFRAAHVSAVNEGVRELAQRRSLPCIDFHGALAVGERFKPGLSEDCQHPNSRGAKLMAQVAEPLLQAAFANRTGGGRCRQRLTLRRSRR